jgi:hypothetical protein
VYTLSQQDGKATEASRISREFVRGKIGRKKYSNIDTKK